MERTIKTLAFSVLFFFLGLAFSYSILKSAEIVLISKIQEKMSWERRLRAKGVLSAISYHISKPKGSVGKGGNISQNGRINLSDEDFSFLWKKGILGFERKEEEENENQNPATQPVVEEVVISPLSTSYKLLGTIIGEREKLAFIMDKRSRKIEVKKMGDEIEPGVKISGIKSDRIEILRGKRKEILFLFEQDEKKFAEASVIAPAKKPYEVISKVIKPYNNPAGRSYDYNKENKGGLSVDLRQVGPDTFEVRREFVQKNLSNMAHLLTSARAIPYIKNGQIQGFRLINISPSSFFRTIGIRNGDIIKKINGISVSNPESIFKILGDIQNETYFEIEIERAGRSKVFKYYVR